MPKKNWNNISSEAGEGRIWDRKPTWTEILAAHEYLQAEDAANKYVNAPNDFSGEDGLDWAGGGKLGENDLPPAGLIDLRRRINWVADRKGAEAIDHDSHGKKLHIGAGISHMGSLIQLAEQSTIAGEVMPRMLVRDEDHEVVPLYLDSEARAMVTAASHQKNRAESAKNILAAKLERALTIIQDPNGGLDATATYTAKAEARLAAIEVHRTLYANIEAELDKALKEVDAKLDELPDDPTEARKKVIHLLEAAGMDRVKAIKGAISQQGTDLPASCDDQADALEAVARIEQLAHIEILRVDLEAEDAIDQMKALLAKAKTDLAAVEALNTPAFTVNGATDTAVAGRVADIIAKQPTDAEVPGNVYIASARIEYADDGTRLTGGRDYGLGIGSVSGDPAAYRYKVTLKDAITRPVKVTIGARNLCGPSEVVVTLTPPAA